MASCPPGSMFALLGRNLDRPAIERIVAEVNEKGGIVDVANINSPSQIVLSGELQALQEAIDMLRKHKLILKGSLESKHSS